MTYEYWKSKYDKTNKVVTDYDAGKTRLSKREVSEAWDEFRYWINKCEHWHTVEGAVQHWGEDEYGRQWHAFYGEKHCNDCGETLESKQLPNGGETSQGLPVLKLVKRDFHGRPIADGAAQ